MSRHKTIPVLMLWLGLAGCKAKPNDLQAEDRAEEGSAVTVSAPEAVAPSVEEAPMPDEVDAEMPGPGGFGYSKGARAKKAENKDRDTRNEPSADDAGGGRGGDQGPAPRAWFPETFLFNPLVVTDDAGHATIGVSVPDRLTSWRVLGLAHSRSGSQAGTVASFEGTLPAYVDPVVPSYLRAGDSVRIPIQMVNNTDQAMKTQLKVQVQGGELDGNPASVSIPMRSSVVEYVDVSAKKAGELRLLAAMGDDDSVIREIPILPVGRPVRESKSGTLAAPRTLAWTFAKSATAKAGVARLSVYPGALSLLRSELGASIHRSGVASDAFALLLAGKAPELLASLGDTPDEKALRTLSITATQKVMKHARVLSIENAALIAEAARSHAGNPVLERLGERAISTIERSQSPDGMCGGESGWTLQRLLVATADCARAAHDSPNVVIRAGGGFERNAKEISDPYTAAAILAAKGATGALRDALQKSVLDAIEERDNGAKVLVVPAGVVRADGRTPSVVEATALAALALADVEDAPLADLGATILANYAPRWGWGDGRANLVCMEAAVMLFKDPLPAVVAIKLRRDGEVVAEGELEREKIREVLELAAEDLEVAGSHEWSVSAEPAVPGLGFSLSLTSWVPWEAKEALGSQLEVKVAKGMSVGKSSSLDVQAIAPSGTPFEIVFALPAGVQLDTASLDNHVASGQLSRYEESEGSLTLYVAPLKPGKRFSGSLRVIPTLAGKLQSGPVMIKVGREQGYLPPVTFTVRPTGS